MILALGRSSINKLWLKFIFPFAIVIGVSSLTGCDQQRRMIADEISPPSPVEIAARVDVSVAENRAKAGIEIGEAYLKSQKDPDGVVHKAMVAAYLSIGDAISAQKHLELTTGSTTIHIVTSSAPNTPPDKSMPTASVEPTAPTSPTAPIAPTAPSSVTQTTVSAGDASVTYSDGKTVVKAGSASVTVSK